MNPTTVPNPSVASLALDRKTQSCFSKRCFLLSFPPPSPAEVNWAPLLLQKPLFIEGTLDVQEFGGEHGKGSCVRGPPLIAAVGGEPRGGGMRGPGTARGVLPELGTGGLLLAKAAEALRKHRSLDRDLGRSQITASLCNTQAAATNLDHRKEKGGKAKKKKKGREKKERERGGRGRGGGRKIRYTCNLITTASYVCKITMQLYN